MTSSNTAPFRALTAVALCDGHDAAIVAVNRALRREGFEVIYLGFNKGPASIVRAAIEEDVDVIGLSSYNGGHIEFAAELLRLMKEAGTSIPIVIGGGGTVTADDAVELRGMGVAEVFAPGQTLGDVARQVAEVCRRHPRTRPPMKDLLPAMAEGDRRAIAAALTAVEANHPRPDSTLDQLARQIPPHDPPPFVIGIAGIGGAGKSTMIDEILLRFQARPGMRVAVVCCDPTTSEAGKDGHEVGGALLGDRIRMLSANSPSVFVRSLATRQHPGGVSGSLARAVRVFSATPFDVVILESAGIGQADNPFAGLVDLSMYVMTSEFGSPLQLEKTVLLETADFIVLNKYDQPAAPAALRTIQQKIRTANRDLKRTAKVFPVRAVHHRDEGVDSLFAALVERLAVARKSKAPELVPAN